MKQEKQSFVRRITLTRFALYIMLALEIVIIIFSGIMAYITMDSSWGTMMVGSSACSGLVYGAYVWRSKSDYKYNKTLEFAKECFNPESGLREISDTQVTILQNILNE